VKNVQLGPELRLGRWSRGAGHGTGPGPGKAYPGIGRAATPRKSRPGTSTCAPTSRACPRAPARWPRAGPVGGQVRHPATASSAKPTRSSRPGRRHHREGREDRPRGAPERPSLPRPHHADEGAHGVHAVGLHQPRHALERAQVAEPDEVYAVTAFLLNLGGVVPDNFVLSTSNMAEVQAAPAQPQRHDHRPRPVAGQGVLGNGGKPDVKAVACMNNCATEPPHGLDAARLRTQRPRQPGRAEPRGRRAARRRHHAARRRAARRSRRKPAAKPTPPAPGRRAAEQAHLHGLPRRRQQDRRPGWRDVAKQARQPCRRSDLPGRQDQVGGTGVWGQYPMPPQTLPDEDAKAIAQWLADGARK
jgi:hypothetical protein